MRRWISLFLILLLLLPAAGGRAFAEDTLSWSLQSGVLTISGRGSMQDFAGDVAPWRSGAGEAQELQVSYGVTHIGSQAFQYMSGLKTAILPQSVTSIGAGAFYGCKELGFVLLPDGLETLETSVFDQRPSTAARPWRRSIFPIPSPRSRTPPSTPARS